MKSLYLMKSYNKIIAVIAVFFLFACASKHILPIAPVQIGSGDELFLRAEKLFQAKSYEKACRIYNEYLASFPDRPLAAAALLKTGAINTTLEKYEKARGIYKRLIAEYKKSSFVPDAMVEILVNFYREGKYEEVVKQGSDVLKTVVSKVHILRTYTLIGDAYVAMNSQQDAAYFYTMAHEISKAPEEEKIIEKLKKVIRQLGSEDIISLLKRVKNKRSNGYLMYLHGLKNAEEEKFDDAIKALSQFIERFPEHEKTKEAKSLVEELDKKFAYGRYTIGCLLPLSGSYKIYGNRALKGIELALSQLYFNNADSHIKIIIKDTGSDPDKAALAVRELSELRVAAIIGPVFTAESAASEAQVAGIPIITLTQKDNITDIGENVFRNFFTPEMQVKTILSFAIKELGLSSFAILYPNDNYGKTFMNLFWDETIICGGKVVGVESYNLDQTDFADSIKKLVGLYYEIPEDIKDATDLIFDEDFNEETDKKQEPRPIVDFDAVFIPDAPKRAGLIIPQMAFYDVNDVWFLGTNLWHSDNLIEMARHYAQNAIMTDMFFAESSSKNVRDFVRVFEKAFKEKPGFIEAVAYDTAMILFQVISRPDIQSRYAIKDELTGLDNFQGVTGLTSFDSNGEVRKKLYLLQMRGDKFGEIGF